jgi:hypothetical protein
MDGQGAGRVAAVHHGVAGDLASLYGGGGASWFVDQGWLLLPVGALRSA